MRRVEWPLGRGGPTKLDWRLFPNLSHHCQGKGLVVAIGVSLRKRYSKGSGGHHQRQQRTDVRCGGMAKQPAYSVQRRLERAHARHAASEISWPQSGQLTRAMTLARVAGRASRFGRQTAGQRQELLIWRRTDVPQDFLMGQHQSAEGRGSLRHEPVAILTSGCDVRIGQGCRRVPSFPTRDRPSGLALEEFSRTDSSAAPTDAPPAAAAP